MITIAEIFLAAAVMILIPLGIFILINPPVIDRLNAAGGIAGYDNRGGGFTIGGGIVRPDDYNAATNARVWVRIG